MFSVYCIGFILTFALTMMTSYHEDKCVALSLIWPLLLILLITTWIKENF